MPQKQYCIEFAFDTWPLSEVEFKYYKSRAISDLFAKAIDEGYSTFQLRPYQLSNKDTIMHYNEVNHRIRFSIIAQ